MLLLKMGGDISLLILLDVLASLAREKVVEVKDAGNPIAEVNKT